MKCDICYNFVRSIVIAVMNLCARSDELIVLL